MSIRLSTSWTRREQLYQSNETLPCRPLSKKRTANFWSSLPDRTLVWNQSTKTLLILQAKPSQSLVWATVSIHVSVYDKPLSGAVLLTNKPLFPRQQCPAPCATTHRHGVQDPISRVPRCETKLHPLGVYPDRSTNPRNRNGKRCGNQTFGSNPIGHGRFEDFFVAFEFDDLMCVFLDGNWRTERPLNFVHGHQGDKGNW